MLFTNREWGAVTFESDGCAGTLNEVNYLEHVEVIVNIEYPVRGQLEIDLISPSGLPPLLNRITLHPFVMKVSFECAYVMQGLARKC